MEPSVCVMVSATPSTIAFLFLRSRPRCCATLMNEQSRGQLVKYSPCYGARLISCCDLHLRVVSSTCLLTLKAATWVSSFPSSSGFFCDKQSASLYMQQSMMILCAFSCTSLVLDIFLPCVLFLSNSCRVLVLGQS